MLASPVLKDKYLCPESQYDEWLSHAIDPSSIIIIIIIAYWKVRPVNVGTDSHEIDRSNQFQSEIEYLNIRPVWSSRYWSNRDLRSLRAQLEARVKGRWWIDDEEGDLPSTKLKNHYNPRFQTSKTNSIWLTSQPCSAILCHPNWFPTSTTQPQHVIARTAN